MNEIRRITKSWLDCHRQSPRNEAEIVIQHIDQKTWQRTMHSCMMMRPTSTCEALHYTTTSLSVEYLPSGGSQLETMFVRKREIEHVLPTPDTSADRNTVTQYDSKEKSPTFKETSRLFPFKWLIKKEQSISETTFTLQNNMIPRNDTKKRSIRKERVIRLMWSPQVTLEWKHTYTMNENEMNEYRLEIELVPETSHPTKYVHHNHFMPLWHSLLSIYTDSPIPILPKTSGWAFHQYKRILSPIFKTLQGPQPVTIVNESKIDETKEYYITEKADGERIIVLCDGESGHVYGMRRDQSVIKLPFMISTNHSRRGFCILDAELVHGVHIYVFDAYVIWDNFVHDQPTHHRILCARRVVAFMKPMTAFSYREESITPIIETKVMSKVNGNEWKTARNFIMNQAANGGFPYQIDGIILTPINESVPSTTTWSTQYKWKPHTESTIDVMVDCAKGCHTYISSLYTSTQMMDHMLEGTQTNGPTHRPQLIDCYPEHSLHTVCPSRICELFHPSWRRNTTVNLSKVFQRVYPFGMVVECSIDVVNQTASTYRLVPLRIRWEKTLYHRKSKTISYRPNFHSTTNSIVYPIIFPEHTTIAYYERTKTRKQRVLRNTFLHHNAVKYSNCISPYIDTQTDLIVDVGIGQAGDLMKWIESVHKSGTTADAVPIIGFDVSYRNLFDSNACALMRWSQLETNMKELHPLLLIEADANQSLKKKDTFHPLYQSQVMRILHNTGKRSQTVMEKKWAKYIHEARSPLISCQFALHYFCESKKTLRQFVRNISHFAKSGCYFSTSFLDGTSLLDMIHSNETDGLVVPGVYSFRPRTKTTGSAGISTSTQPTFGSMIDVFIESIGTEHPEYITYLDLILPIFEQHGWVLHDSKLFSECLSDHEFDPTFSSLYRFVIFRFA